MSPKKNLRSIATHSFVASVFSNPLFILIIAEFYKLLSSTTSPIVLNEPVFIVMTLVSFTAFALAFVTYFLYSNSQTRRTILIAVALLIVSWFISQIFIPLGLLCVAVAAGILVYGTAPVKKR